MRRVHWIVTGLNEWGRSLASIQMLEVVVSIGKGLQKRCTTHHKSVRIIIGRRANTVFEKHVASEIARISESMGE